MKITTVLGTRPEIIKLSPLIPLLNKHFEHSIVHTGQHYSYQLDKVFFEELDLPAPYQMLEVGSESQVKQVAKIMLALEPILSKDKPNLVLVHGDTNSTLAGALAANKLAIPVGHVEAGCRSFNKLVPEELNRLLTDHCSSILFTSDNVCYHNLLQEGIERKLIHEVGSTLVDACFRNLKFAENSQIMTKLDLKEQEYALVTIHRAENTERPDVLLQISKALNKISERLPLVFPMHPRTKKYLKTHDIKVNSSVKTIEPVGYLDFLKLISGAAFVMTDSGGVQEEAVVLNNVAVILRSETEWTSFIDAGKNILSGTNSEQIYQTVTSLIENPNDLRQRKEAKISLNHGATEKIIKILLKNTKFA